MLQQVAKMGEPFRRDAGAGIFDCDDKIIPVFFQDYGGLNKASAFAHIMGKYIFHHIKKGKFGTAPFVVQFADIPADFETVYQPFFLDGNILPRHFYFPGHRDQILPGKGITHQVAEGICDIGYQFLMIGFRYHADAFQRAIKEVGIELVLQGLYLCIF